MTKTMRAGFGEAVLEMGQVNPDLIVLSADVSDSLRLQEFKRCLPQQYLEVGISEQNMIGVAAGLAQTGKTVIVTSFATFNPGRNWEQIRQSICEQNLNVKIVGSHAGLATGADGATHQMLEDLALMTVLPKMTVVVPSDYQSARKATAELVLTPGPAYLRLAREGGGSVQPESSVPLAPHFSLGQGRILALGKEVTLVACGLMVELALQAVKQLYREEALPVALLELSTLKPLDTSLLEKFARETGAIVTAEEHQLTGGLGSLVASHLSQTYPVPIEMVGVADRFGQSGTKEELFCHYGLTVGAIKDKVWHVLERK